MIFPATWLVLSTVAIIMVLFGLGYYWARSNGQFDDIEMAKYSMLEDPETDDAADDEL